ncbi:MAG: 30S ribosomal protein S16 [Phycisphaerales bacterium]|nr:30S ribosomal protein S16 [Phycisphaerales bacterium]
MVRLRLKRVGRRHQPCYRITAVDQRKKRDGRVIEELGHYDPEGPDPATQVVLNGPRIQYWLGVGAQPTDTVRGLMKRAGMTVPASA